MFYTDVLSIEFVNYVNVIYMDVLYYRVLSIL